MKLEKVRENVVKLVEDNQALFRKMNYGKKIDYIGKLDKTRPLDGETEKLFQLTIGTIHQIKKEETPPSKGYCQHAGAVLGASLELVIGK